jgi:hypothetical protein
MKTFGERITGVLQLDSPTFEEIEHDRSATGQALAVVIASSIASGLGAGIAFGGGGLIRQSLAALVGWIVWAGLTFLIGTRLLPETQTQATLGQLMRVIGFASAPNVFALFAFIPLLGAVIRFAVWLWVLATTVVAVRQALDYRSTLRALMVVVVGWVVYVVLQAIF